MSPPTWISRVSAAIIAFCRHSKSWLFRDLALLWAVARPLLRLLTLVVLLIGGWMIIQNWDWLSNDVWTWLGTAPNGQGRQESNSTTLRNIGLVIAGIIALPLAVWRSIVAQRQADAALRQADTALRQAATSEQGLLNDRYQKGAEMLGNDVLSVRLGGIYALQRLAEEHPEQYHVQIMRLFCGFVRHPTRYESAKTEQDRIEAKQVAEEDQCDSTPRLREDVQAVMRAIADRKKTSIVLEEKADFRLDFSYADLRGMDIWGWDTDLSRAQFQGANLSGASIMDSKLSRAEFEGANLSDADLVGADLHLAELEGAILPNANLGRAHLTSTMLMGADLTCANLASADLSGAHLGGPNIPPGDIVMISFGPDSVGANLSAAYLGKVKNLTQAQLDEARADPKKPPRLDGALDAETGKPLVWRGKPLDDEA